MSLRSLRHAFTYAYLWTVSRVMPTRTAIALRNIIRANGADSWKSICCHAWMLRIRHPWLPSFVERYRAHCRRLEKRTKRPARRAA